MRALMSLRVVAISLFNSSWSLCILTGRFNPLMFFGITDIFCVLYLPRLFCISIDKFLLCPVILPDQGRAPRPPALQGDALAGVRMSCRVLGTVVSPWLDARCLPCEMGITELNLSEGGGGTTRLLSATGCAKL